MKFCVCGRSEKITSILLVVLLFLPCFAQADKEPGKDHPLLSRYPNSRIANYEQNFNEVEFLLGKKDEGGEKRELMEGEVTKISYFHNDREKQPSPLQLLRNFQNAIKEIGGEVVAERKPTDTDGGETTLRAVVKDKEYWVKLTPEIYSAPTQSYKLILLERKAMEQVVTANKMLDELNTKGFVTLHINFDTNKSEIKPEALPTIREISEMLKSSAELKVSIEGHTDNVGTPEANKALSDNRAKSVLDALVEGGIDGTRLKSIGFGQEKPVADNSTESGKAKNRRVELVKM